MAAICSSRTDAKSRSGAARADALAALAPARLCLLLLVLLAGCGRAPRATPAPAPSGPGRPVQMLATTPTGETVALEVAISDAERARGLMYRSEVPRGTGMYFRFSYPGRHSFWMLNCLVPLDIAWLDERGAVVDLVENVPVCSREPCPTYQPRAAATQVIELASGEARRMGIVPGARVLLQPDGGTGR